MVMVSSLSGKQPDRIELFIFLGWVSTATCAIPVAHSCTDTDLSGRVSLDDFAVPMTLFSFCTLMVHRVVQHHQVSVRNLQVKQTFNCVQNCHSIVRNCHLNCVF